jgi:hypothetical protein
MLFRGLDRLSQGLLDGFAEALLDISESFMSKIVLSRFSQTVLLRLPSNMPSHRSFTLVMLHEIHLKIWLASMATRFTTRRSVVGGMNSFGRNGNRVLLLATFALAMSADSCMVDNRGSGAKMGGRGIFIWVDMKLFIVMRCSGYS